MRVLPEMICLPAEASEAEEGAGAVSRLLLRVALSPRAGSDLVVPRLIDALIIFIVRAWLERQPLDCTGWLGALRDVAIGRALERIHERPEERWTVAARCAPPLLSGCCAVCFRTVVD